MSAQISPGRKNPGGRRPGESGTRDAILDAALRLFSEHGYDGASVRAIAAGAGVDPALIRHFFGDKDGLFAAVVTDRTAVTQRLSQAVSADPDELGRAVTDAYLRLWEAPDTGPILLALVRSVTASETAASMLRAVMISRISTAPWVEAERSRHVALAAAHLFGVAAARHVLKVAPITEFTHDELVDQIAPTIQRYLDGTHR
ncbi:TetR/AcrR family transcriptional regulator [Cellulomonas composti]|uniref:TetR/AcrR family transcriptional regulator n=1 Tax=Cellulomonas composti TaxID=266130 RepID=UPI0016499154|nr:TetR family transcriptional regulator [Cellulomonas composti]